jgi:predicted permease
MIESVFQDLRHAFRTFRSAPLWTVAAVLTLALGIGATTGIVSVLDAVLLEPLPYRDPDRRVMIWSRWRGFDKTWLSDAEVLDYRERLSTLADVAAWSPGQGNLVGDGEPLRVGLARVTANVFSVLGVDPLFGRTFTSAEDLPGGPPAAVLGHTLWRQRYGGEPGVIGRSVDLDGVSYQVVGVMPDGFQLPTDFNVSATEPSLLYLPLQIDPNDLSRGSHGLYAAAALAPGATALEATAELSTLTRTLTQEGLYHEAMEFEALAVPVEEEILGSVRPAVLLLLGAVSFLLLIACANVANLLLAAAEGRQLEMAVRTALGAGRGRLVRQLLTEGLSLAALAGGLGLLIAWAGIRLASAANPTVVPRASGIQMDLPVVAFAAALAVLTSLVFSLVPALRASRGKPSSSLREASQRATSGQTLRSALVVAEMALAVVLVIGAGLMIRSLESLGRIELGFEPDNVLTLKVSLPAASYDSPEKVVRFYDELLVGVRALPGVERAGALRSLPLAAPIGDWGLDVEGFVETPGNNAKGDWQVASDGASEAVGERLVAGRLLQPTDTIDSQLVALVNETMARRYWDDGNPLGKRIRMGARETSPWVTVVGVVGDVRHNGITEPVKEKFVMPHAQFHRSTGFAITTMTLVVETGPSSSPLLVAQPIRSLVRSLDPNLPVSSVRLLTDVVNDSIATTRVTGFLLGLFGAVALGLAAVGVYAVLSYLVSRRRREIGIRIAMGADAGDVLGLVLGRGFLTSAFGIALGVLASVGLTRLMASLLHEVRPMDPLTFLVAPAILASVALLASYLPARRAARVDPVVALRMD